MEGGPKFKGDAGKETPKREPKAEEIDQGRRSFLIGVGAAAATAALGTSGEVLARDSDPVTEAEADLIQMGLKHLGYYARDMHEFTPTIEGNEELREAIKRYQKEQMQREDPDGELDRETRDKILMDAVTH